MIGYLMSNCWKITPKPMIQPAEATSGRVLACLALAANPGDCVGTMGSM